VVWCASIRALDGDGGGVREREGGVRTVQPPHHHGGQGGGGFTSLMQSVVLAGGHAAAVGLGVGVVLGYLLARATRS
jgi:hypothetical protein